MSDARSSLDQPPYGMYVICAGLVAVVAVAVAAIVRYDSAADAVTVLGSATGVIGALVGAYFGMRGATLAQQKANEAPMDQGAGAAPSATSEPHVRQSPVATSSRPETVGTVDPGNSKPGISNPAAQQADEL